MFVQSSYSLTSFYEDLCFVLFKNYISLFPEASPVVPFIQEKMKLAFPLFSDRKKKG